MPIDPIVNINKTSEINFFIAQSPLADYYWVIRFYI